MKKFILCAAAALMFGLSFESEGMKPTIGTTIYYVATPFPIKIYQSASNIRLETPQMILQATNVLGDLSIFRETPREQVVEILKKHYKADITVTEDPTDLLAFNVLDEIRKKQEELERRFPRRLDLSAPRVTVEPIIAKIDPSLMKAKDPLSGVKILPPPPPYDFEAECKKMMEEEKLRDEPREQRKREIESQYTTTEKFDLDMQVVNLMEKLQGLNLTGTLEANLMSALGRLNFTDRSKVVEISDDDLFRSLTSKFSTIDEATFKGIKPKAGSFRAPQKFV